MANGSLSLVFESELTSFLSAAKAEISIRRE